MPIGTILLCTVCGRKRPTVNILFHFHAPVSLKIQYNGHSTRRSRSHKIRRLTDRRARIESAKLLLSKFKSATRIESFLTSLPIRVITILSICFKLSGITDASIFLVGHSILRSVFGIQLTVPKPQSSVPAGHIDRVRAPQNALQDGRFIPAACYRPMTNYFS